MDLKIAEKLQFFREEATAHWQTGAVMTTVAIVVGKVYGRAAVVGVVLITASNYQIIGKQIRVLTWTSLRKTLIAVVLFGNSYYNIINPQIMSYIAVALMLIDNFQLSSLNDDLSTQNATLKQNNARLKEAYEALKKLEDKLLILNGAATRVEAAQQAQDGVIAVLEPTIPEWVRDLPARLKSVAGLLEQLQNSKEFKELRKYKEDLRKQIQTMLGAFGELIKELKPLSQHVERLSANLETTVSNFQGNVVLQGRQIEALGNAIQAIQQLQTRLR